MSPGSFRPSPHLRLLLMQRREVSSSKNWNAPIRIAPSFDARSSQRIMMSKTTALSLAVGLLSLVALPAYPQQRDLQGAIKAYVSKQGPLSEKPTQVMADLDGDGHPEAIVTFCIDENMPGGKNEGANNPANVHCHLSVFRQTKD